MRRRTTTLIATLALMALLPVTAVFAGGGLGQAPPDRVIGPSLNVSVVMDATPPPPGSDPTIRQFAVSVQRGVQSRSVMFPSARTYQYGCQQPVFPTLKASTEQRFIGLLANWAPYDSVAALIRSAGDPSQATIVEILDIVCTTVEIPGEQTQEYLSFTGRIQFVRP